MSKFKDMVYYICEKSACDDKFGRLKLNKLMYFSDFGFYRESGESISGAEYMRIKNGPVPRQMKPLLEMAFESGTLTERVIQKGAHKLQKPEVVGDVDYSSLSPAELRWIDAVIEKYSDFNGTEMSDISHLEPGWKAANDRETIPYGTAFFPLSQTITESDISRTKELIGEFSW